MNIYERAERYGVTPDGTCADVGISRWEKLMEGHTKANRVKVIKAAIAAGFQTEEEGRIEIRRPYYNPYNHYKTKTHLIYVHSSIEHFIRVNKSYYE